MLKKLALSIVLMFSACTEQPADNEPRPVGDAVLELCGPVPTIPNISPTFEGDRVVLTQADFDALQYHTATMALWSACASTLP